MEEPMYIKIHNQIKRDIENHVYQVGDRIPAERPEESGNAGLSPAWSYAASMPKIMPLHTTLIVILRRADV